MMAVPPRAANRLRVLLRRNLDLRLVRHLAINLPEEQRGSTLEWVEGRSVSARRLVPV